MILVGDVREKLKELPDESAHCVITSPPYWGLRDYGTPGQLGLEPTVDEWVANMVAVFAEVRRVLRDAGTLWLNLGDGYHANQGAGFNGQVREDEANRNTAKALRRPPGLKPKDLIGQPWRLAFALQQPQYTGRIKNVEDRIWLAAMIEAEGCIFIHKRKVGQNNGQGYSRKTDSYGSGLEVSNRHRAIVERCMAIAQAGSICTQGPDENHRRKQTLYRWNLRTNECREILREIYPHVISKQHEIRLACGCPSSGKEAEAAHGSLKALHQGGEATIDFPAPKSMFEPGWYLRSDIIYAKSNPMPESVTDRPTKSHEYLFLLAKRPTYYYNAEAIREPAEYGRREQPANMYSRMGDASNAAQHVAGTTRGADPAAGRNKRDVWTIATQPYPEAHFATFPEALVRPCVRAGCPVGGTVLDPFLGSGTTMLVAHQEGRNCIGIELNPEYARLAQDRCRDGIQHQLL